MMLVAYPLFFPILTHLACAQMGLLPIFHYAACGTLRACVGDMVTSVVSISTHFNCVNVALSKEK